MNEAQSQSLTGMKDRLARWLSILLDSSVLAVLVFIGAAWSETGAFLPALGWAALALLIVDGIPLTYIALGRRLGLVSGFDLPRREERAPFIAVNLIGNALQYTPAGGQVDLTVQRKENGIQIIVADTGIGIPAEHQPHLFTRFYRVDKSRARASGGSGIGLTIARYLVEAHYGRIWAESDGLGQGSRFLFWLPLTQRYKD